MRRYFFLAIFCFLSGERPVFSQSEPYVMMSPEMINELPGWGVPSTKGLMLNCPNLLNKTWAYPSGGVVAICNQAEYSCFQYGLIKDQLKKEPTRELRQMLALAQQDVELKLLGCKLAIEAGIGGTPFLPGTESKESRGVYQKILK